MIFLALLAVSLQNFVLPDLHGVEPQVAEKIQRLQKEAQQHPSSAEAWGKLCVNLQVHDFQKEAADCYERVLALQPNEFRWRYFQAIAIQEITPAEAVPRFESCVKLKPQYAPLHLRYAQALLAAGRNADAEKEFREAMKFEPVSADAYLGLARIQVAQKKPEAAKTTLLEAIQKFPKRGELHGLLSEVYRVLDDPPSAEKELALSQQLPVKVPPPDPELTPLLMEGVSSYWYELRARALMERGDFAGASSQLEAAIKALPDPRLYDLLGISYQYQKKYANAAEAHQKALELNPKSPATMSNLASALTAMGKYQQAIDVLKKAIQVQPDFLHSYLQLALTYASTGDFNRAIETARKAQTRAASSELKNKIQDQISLYEQKKIPHD